jgi:hypothetical protein
MKPPSIIARHAFLRTIHVAIVALALAGCASKKAPADGADSTTSVAGPVDSAVTVATLRGATSDAIVGDLQSLGLTCRPPVVRGNATHWVCMKKTKELMCEVEVTGVSPTAIASISATSVVYTGNSDEIARAFLGKVAAVHYNGADPFAAMKWVELNMGKSAETTFGNVTFLLGGAGGTRVLRIHAEAW